MGGAVNRSRGREKVGTSFEGKGKPVSNRSHAEAAGIGHKRLLSVDIVCITCSYKNITAFNSRQVFDERISLWFFLHNAFHVGVSRRSKNLILHTIFVVYPSVNFMNNGLSIFQKLHVRCNSSSEVI